MDYNAVAVRAPEVRGHCDCCFSVEVLLDFAVRKGLDMQAIAAARGQVFEAQDENAVMVGLNTPGRIQMEGQQAVNTAAA